MYAEACCLMLPVMYALAYVLPNHLNSDVLHRKCNVSEESNSHVEFFSHFAHSHSLSILVDLAQEIHFLHHL